MSNKTRGYEHYINEIISKNTILTFLLLNPQTDCTSDPLLHFPFIEHYNDVSCNGAQGLQLWRNLCKSVNCVATFNMLS